MFSLQLLVAVTAIVAIIALSAAPMLAPWDNDPVLDSELIVVAIGVILVLLTFIGPNFKTISGRQRTALSAIRLAVVVLVVLGMLRPTCVQRIEKQQSASLVLLFDISRSMQLPSASDGKSRWEMQLESLQENEALLNELRKDIDVKIYAYDSELHPVAFENDALQFPSDATGDLTDIGSPLDAAVAAERTNRLVGAILMGDGVQTIYDPQVEMYFAVRQLNDLQLPLWSVAFGPEGDAAQSPDIAVENLPDQYSVFVKNELGVRAMVRARSFANIEFPVQLLVRDAAGNETVVDTRNIKSTRNDEQKEVTLTFTPQEPGQYTLTVRVPAQQNEDVTLNNELSAFLNVFEGGLGVLYLEGDLRLEQKFLRRSIDLSPDIELDFQWIDHRRRDSWPVEIAELIKSPQYDVIILGDLDSRALFEEGTGEGNLKAITAAVADGKGLLMMGGYHSFGPGRYQLTPLADVLPIKMDKFEAQDFDSKINESLHVAGPLKMLPESRHYLTQLAPDEENESVWQALPPLDGANKFVGLKDRAQVLAAAEDETPLLIASQYGEGRVLAFAGDSTWRWWMQGHRDAHKRFWRQVILWLAKRDDQRDEDVWIRLAQRRYNPGARVDFTVGANTAVGDVISDASFLATVTSPGGTPQQVSLVANGPTRRGQFDQTLKPGTYTVEVSVEPLDVALRPLGSAHPLAPTGVSSVEHAGERPVLESSAAGCVADRVAGSDEAVGRRLFKSMAGRAGKGVSLRRRCCVDELAGRRAVLATARRSAERERHPHNPQTYAHSTTAMS